MTNQNESLSPETVSIQPELRPDLTPVLRNRDHRQSTLQRASTFFDEAHLRRLNIELVELLGGAHGDNPLGLERAEDLSVCLIDSMICPKDPARLKQRLDEEPLFGQMQTRRGGTEARVAVFKNHTGARVWRAKGFENRARAVGWSVLAHNLQWVARRAREEQEGKRQQAPPKSA